MGRWLVVLFGLVSSLGFASGKVTLVLEEGPNSFEPLYRNLKCKFEVDSSDQETLALVTAVQKNSRLEQAPPMVGPDISYKIHSEQKTNNDKSLITTSLLYSNNSLRGLSNPSKEAQELISIINGRCLAYQD